MASLSPVVHFLGTGARYAPCTRGSGRGGTAARLRVRCFGALPRVERREAEPPFPLLAIPALALLASGVTDEVLPFVHQLLRIVVRHSPRCSTSAAAAAARR